MRPGLMKTRENNETLYYTASYGSARENLKLKFKILFNGINLFGDTLFLLKLKLVETNFFLSKSFQLHLCFTNKSLILSLQNSVSFLVKITPVETIKQRMHLQV